MKQWISFVAREVFAWLQELRAGQVLVVIAGLLLSVAFVEPILDIIDSFLGVLPKRPVSPISATVREWSTLALWGAAAMIVTGAYLEIRASRRRLSELS